jgi:ADP-ribosyl-[dinitrogen reductase] hydrolase
VLGAIAGDVIGSVYEFFGVKTIDFALLSRQTTFTDDSVMTAAVAACVLGDGDYADLFREFGRKHPATARRCE